MKRWKIRTPRCPCGEPLPPPKEEVTKAADLICPGCGYSCSVEIRVYVYSTRS